MRGRLWAAACVVVACGPALEPGATFDEHDVTREEAPAGAIESIALPSAVHDVVIDDGAVLLATETGVFLQRGNDAPLALAPLRLDDADPESSGAARRLATRPGGAGIAIAAAQGIYVWNMGALVRSPLSAVASSPELIASGTFGGEERLVTYVAGRLVVGGGAAREVTLDPAPEHVSAIAHSNGTTFLADGASLICVVERGDGFEVTRAEPEAGALQALAVDTNGALWLAAEEGLLRRTESFDTVAWDKWPLDEGAYGLAFDPDGAGIWVRTKDGAVRVNPTTHTGLSVRIDGTPGALAIDFSGQLWTADASGSRVLRRGGLQAPAPSFASQIDAFSKRHCASCHGAGASLPLVTREEWSTNAERILLNLEVGTMPRGNPLTAAEYRIVQRWVTGGMQP